MKLLVLIFGVLIAILVAAIWGASKVWLSGADVEIGFHGGAALILGALGSLLIGGLLMALLFYSSKYGYDEQVFSADDENQWD
ncbi:MAG: hypothetical protein VX491_11205 [Pseudomonadota bacterium]|nr:hypothetical protein [Pseudomonadota bacterium]|tara:strand:+ start:648 stop:896 length:249 start_codon:yes stop_codon:yes gene_type:complete